MLFIGRMVFICGMLFKIKKLKIKNIKIIKKAGNKEKNKKKERKVDIKWKITKQCLDFILESAKSIYPKEFAGLLRAEHRVIKEVLILPGTVQGDRHAIFNFAMLPIDFSVVGTVHSHPSPSYLPSEADLQLFSKKGRVHIIVAMPFNEDSWQGYNWEGKMIEIEVV